MISRLSQQAEEARSLTTACATQVRLDPNDQDGTKRLSSVDPVADLMKRRTYSTVLSSWRLPPEPPMTFSAASLKARTFLLYRDPALLRREVDPVR